MVKKTPDNLILFNSHQENDEKCLAIQKKLREEYGTIEISLSIHLKDRYPDLYAQIDHTKYDQTFLQSLIISSTIVLTWICTLGCCPHPWDASVSSRVKNDRGCPCSSGKKKYKCECKTVEVPQAHSCLDIPSDTHVEDPPTLDGSFTYFIF